MVIFDKSNQSNMLYTNPKYDISDRLIKALGFVPVKPLSQGGEENKSIQDQVKDAANKGKDADGPHARRCSRRTRRGNTISRSKN